MPPGSLVTRPWPTTATVSRWVRPNRTLTARGPVAVTVQVSPATVSHPSKPERSPAGPGTARSVTRWPGANPAAHEAPQSMPGGSLVTAPGPERVTDTAHVLEKVAVTTRSAVIVTRHVVADAGSQPVHVTRGAAAGADAVSTTVVPGG